MPRLITWWWPALLSLVLLTGCPAPTPEKAGARFPASPASPLRIAAAADLRYALDSLLVLFAAQSPAVSMAVTYGSSGKFYEQISHGAPFAIFFSADTHYPQQLQAQGLTLAAPVPYATGQLVLWSKTLDPAARGMATLLDPRLRKLALANPTHAPYGQRAVEVLRHYQLYDRLRPRLVYGENIAQTANYAASGAAEAGLIALALALSPELRAQGRYFLIPQSAYTPLAQCYVVLKGAGQHPAAARFAAFVASAPARAVLRAYGFHL